MRPVTAVDEVIQVRFAESAFELRLGGSLDRLDFADRFSAPDRHDVGVDDVPGVEFARMPEGQSESEARDVARNGSPLFDHFHCNRPTRRPHDRPAISQ